MMSMAPFSVPIAALAWALGVLCGACSCRAEVASSFTRIANQSTPIPGGSGSFIGLGLSPSISGEGTEISFIGNGSNGQRGVYHKSGAGPLTVYANKSTPVPGSSGNFTDFGVDVTSNGTDAAFNGTGASVSGVYARSAGSLVRVADTTMSVPGGTGTFASFSGQYINDISNAVAFQAMWGTYQSGSGWSHQGIYTNLGGTLRRVAARGQAMPGVGGVFSWVEQPTIEGSVLALLGTGSAGAAIFAENGGVLSPLVRNNTFVPGANTSFRGLHYLSTLRDGTLTFTASSWDYPGSSSFGVYTLETADGSVTTVADHNTAAPGGGFFTNFGSGALDGEGNVAFIAFDSAGIEGLYLKGAGGIRKIIEVGDPLDGKYVNYLWLGRDGIDAGTIAFTARFHDFTDGIYTISIPEPAGLVVPVLALTFMSRRRVRRSR